MKALMPRLDTLEEAIEREREALEDNRQLIVPDAAILPIEQDRIDAFASSFDAGLSDVSFDEENIESTARKLVREFLNEFGANLLNRCGLEGFQESIIPGLKAVIERLTE